MPLDEVVDSYFSLQGELPGRSRAAAASVLDQVPEIGVKVRGRGLPEVLESAYRALAD